MTKFGIDQQTIDDLNIFPQLNSDLSIFEYYNYTQTKGGSDVLQTIIAKPMNDLMAINSRLSVIKHMVDRRLKLRIVDQDLDFISYYLKQNTDVLIDNFYYASKAKFKDYLKPTNDYYIINKGLESIRNHILNLNYLLKDMVGEETPIFFVGLKEELRILLNALGADRFLKPKGGAFSFMQVSHFDHLIRSQHLEKIKALVESTYLLDAYCSIAEATKAHGLGFPQFSEADEPQLKLTAFFHPFLKHPVKNDFQIEDHKNLCFVSGANMAGKSTFLKSVALSVYLAHLGFPVPAQTMELSLFNGLYTTINLSDNLSKGYSHYYSEVKRVKEIALNIKEKKKVLIIFDELFRGTNVKDAFDGTLMVSEGFTKIKASLFFISTHIVEVAEALKSSNEIDFLCFESTLKQNIPTYNYKLKAGISTERLGLSIIKNENIMEILHDIAKN